MIAAGGAPRAPNMVDWHVVLVCVWAGVGGVAARPLAPGSVGNFETV